MHNTTQPQMVKSQRRMKRIRLRESSFRIRDQSTAHLGLLPANLPNAPLNTESNDTTESSVSIGVTVGCTLLLITIVSLLTIFFCVWHRKKALRSKALDCRKSPWTQRYRDGKTNGISRPEMRMSRTLTGQMDAERRQKEQYDQQGNTYTIYKDTPSLEGNDSYSKESEIDPSFQNEKRMAKQEIVQNEASYLNESTTKRRTKLPDVWCSPVLPMPDSVRMSPRVRSSVFQNPHGHQDVIRSSPMKTATNGEDSSATMIGLGLMVDSDTAIDYTIVDDPSPVEKTGDLWDPVKGALHEDLICSADKYAALMPKSSILRHSQSKKTGNLDVMSRSPSETSIYTAVSLSTLVMEERTIPATLSKDEDEKKRDSDIFQPTSRGSFAANLKQRNPKKSKTVPSLRGERKSRTSSSRLLDEIFDEKTDARVTRTFTAAMRMMKKNLKARKPPTQSKNEKGAISEDMRPVSVRSLARRSEVRRRTKTQFDRTSALLLHAVSPYTEEQISSPSPDKQFNHSKQSSNDSMNSANSSLRLCGKNHTDTMEFHLPSRLSASGAKVFTLSPQKMIMPDTIMPSTPQNKQSYTKANPLLRKRTLRTIGQDNLVLVPDSKSRGSVLLTAKAVHRKSRSLDSCLSSAILGYLHTPTSFKAPGRSNTGPYMQPALIPKEKDQIQFCRTILVPILLRFGFAKLPIRSCSQK